MIVPPLALLLGGLGGFLLRGHDRALRVAAVAAPIASLLALAAQFVPGGATECTSSTSGVDTCMAVPAVSGWAGPLPYAIAVGLIVLSVAAYISVRMHDWRPAGVSALLQAVPQVISFGGFIDWAPALLLTIAVACAVAWKPAAATTLHG